MEFKDIKHSSLIKYLYAQNKGLEYKGYVFGYGPRNNSTGEDSVSFFNKDVGEYIDVTPIADGKINQEIYNTNFIEDAVSKSEDQKTLNKRIEKIFLSSYKEIIDDAVKEIEKQNTESTNDFGSVSGMSKEEKDSLIKFLIGKEVDVSEFDGGNVGVGRITHSLIDDNQLAFDVKIERKIYSFFVSSSDVDEFIYGKEVHSEDINEKEDITFSLNLLIPYTKQNVQNIPNEQYTGEDEKKLNNQEYKYYIISKGRILSGWEFKEDARDALKELPPVRRSESRVVSKRDMTIDVSDDGNWGDPDVNESEIIPRARTLFLERSLDLFSGTIDNDKIKESVMKASPRDVLKWYMKELMSRASEAKQMELNDMFLSINTELNHVIELLSQYSQK